MAPLPITPKDEIRSDTTQKKSVLSSLVLFIYLLTLDLMVYIAMVFKNFSPSTSLFRKQIDFHMVAIGVST